MEVKKTIELKFFEDETNCQILDDESGITVGENLHLKIENLPAHMVLIIMTDLGTKTPEGCKSAYKEAEKVLFSSYLTDVEKTFTRTVLELKADGLLKKRQEIYLLEKVILFCVGIKNGQKKPLEYILRLEKEKDLQIRQG